MYGSKKDKKTLHERWFFNIQKSALKGSLKLENLPPTEGATKQHAYKSYLQLQQWLGYKKDPTVWGWKERQNVIYPVHTLEPLIPDELLSKISCRCETGDTAISRALREFVGTLKCGKKCQLSNEPIFVYLQQIQEPQFKLFITKN